MRKIRDFLPRPLAWTTLALFTAAAVFIAWTGTLPAYAPIPYGSDREDPEGFRTIGGDGRIPGIELAGWLGTALVVLAAGSWLVLLLISRRRQLEQLTDQDNSLLRTIAMNRLLRTVATVASGLAAIAGNFAARPDPAAGSTSWTNFAGIAGMAVLLAMLVWAPPRLAGPAGSGAGFAKPAVGAHPAARLVSSIGAALGVAAVLPLMVGVFLVPAIMAAAAGYGPYGFVALAAGLVLVVLAAGELLLTRNYASADQPRTWPRQPLGPALLTTAILALLVFVTTLVVSAFGNFLIGREGAWLPPAVLSAAGVVLALPAFLATRRRHGIRDAAPGVDAALRAITVYRIVRTLSAMFMAQAAVVLLMNSPAWAVVFGAELMPAIPWWPASLAGALLAGAAIVTAFVPVRALAGSASRPVPLPDRAAVS